MRAGRCLGMILDGKNGRRFSDKSLQTFVIETHVRRFEWPPGRIQQLIRLFG